MMVGKPFVLVKEMPNRLLLVQQIIHRTKPNEQGSNHAYIIPEGTESTNHKAGTHAQKKKRKGVATSGEENSFNLPRTKNKNGQLIYSNLAIKQNKSILTGPRRPHDFSKIALI
jgi:hypothetical protein